MRRAVAGFTLIEMMVVIVLIGVMASMVRISQGDNHARLARQEADVLLNLVVDVSYSLLNPRIRVQGGGDEP